MTYLGHFSSAPPHILRRGFCSVDAPGTESDSKGWPQSLNRRKSRLGRLRQCRTDKARFDPDRTVVRPGPGGLANPSLPATSAPVDLVRGSELRPHRLAHGNLPD